MIKTGKKIIRFIFSRNFFLLLFLLTQIAFFVFTFTIANRYATKILGGTTTIIAFIVAMCINNSRLHSDTKLAYIIILVLFPIYGTLAYLLAYFGRGKRRFTRYNEQKEKIKPLKQNFDVIDSLSSNHQLGLAEHLYNNLNFPIYSNTSAKYYKSGEEMFEDMKTAMKKAKKFIFLEYFIISKGEMLNSIINILTEKAREGVEVRFMYDGTNSIARIPHSFVKKMNKLNIKCKMFMPVRAILSTEQNNRDHRKLLIIDNKITFTGGINLADEYINKINRFGYWKDVGIKIEGQAVESFTQMFLKMWNFRQKNIEDFTPYLTKSTKSKNSNGYFIPISDHPHDTENTSKTIILHLLNHATKYVYITTPYLLLDDELRNAIINCAKRNVEIKIITPNTPDKKLIFCLTQLNYKDLINNNIKIYQFTKGFVHAKLILSDDIVATIGSVNLDYRSLYLNFENSVYIYKSNTILDMKEDFLSTLNDCKLIDKIEYKKINPFKKFIAYLIKIFAPLL